QDPSPFVRQAAVGTLGVRLHDNPQLVGPFIERLKVEPDSWTKQLAAWSLKTVPTSQVESIRPLINQTVPEVDAVVIVPGVYKIIQNENDAGRDLNYDSTKDWPIRRILELAGVKVFEQRWSGKYSDVKPTMPILESTTLRVLNRVGERGIIMEMMYSGANWIGEIFDSPNLNPIIKQAFDDGRINLISLGSISTYNFSILDKNWKNIWSEWDIISRFSEAKSPNQHDVKINYFPDQTFNVFDSHFVYKDPRFTSLIAYQALPNLFMPQLSQIASDPNINNWNYFPKRGNWPSVYSFGSVAPRDYYLQNSTGLSTNMSLQDMQQFRSPDNYFLQQNPAQSFPRGGIPRIPFMTAPRVEPPKINITPSPNFNLNNRPVFNSNSDGSRNIRFVPVAPPNYYNSPAARVPSYTPPPTFTPPPTNFNVGR
ncbi:MAG: HEAT repeat domain-containing protein, partial [Clostridia bacterium]